MRGPILMRLTHAGVAGVVLLACAERHESDEPPVVSEATATCEWRDSEAVTFSDLRIDEASGDYSGLEVVFTRDNSAWGGTWRFGEGPVSSWYDVDSLEFDEATGSIGFILPAVEGNLAMRFDGAIWCDSLVANQTFGTVSRVRRLPRTREP